MLLAQAIIDSKLDPKRILPQIDTSHHLALMTHGFERQNVRGLIAVVNRIISLVERGVASVDAIESAFSHLEGPTTKAPRSRTVQQAPPKGQSRQTPIERFEQQLRKLVVAAQGYVSQTSCKSPNRIPT